MTEYEAIPFIDHYARTQWGCIIGLPKPTAGKGIDHTGEHADWWGASDAWHTRCVEYKRTASDRRADRSKKHRTEPWRAIGRYRYLCCPTGVLRFEDCDPDEGLLWIDEEGGITEVRPAPDRHELAEPYRRGRFSTMVELGLTLNAMIHGVGLEPTQAPQSPSEASGPKPPTGAAASAAAILSDRGGRERLSTVAKELGMTPNNLKRAISRAKHRGEAIGLDETPGAPTMVVLP